MTLMASMPNVPPQIRSSIQRNVMEMLHLHEHLLNELEVVSNSQGRLIKQALAPDGIVRGQRHVLPLNESAVSAGQGAASHLLSAQAISTDSPAVPEEAADVARVFKKIVSI